MGNRDAEIIGEKPCECGCGEMVQKKRRRMVVAYKEIAQNFTDMEEGEDPQNFTDRYQALGIPYPDQKTMCKGQCEGTGWVPVRGEINDVDGLLYMEEGEDPRLIALWREAHEKSHTIKQRIKSAIKCRDVRILFEKCDGWHFVKCPDCNGTGRETGMDRPWKVDGLTDSELAEAYFNSWQSAHKEVCRLETLITEKDREIERIQTNIDVMKRALRWSECEEDWDG